MWNKIFLGGNVDKRVGVIKTAIEAVVGIAGAAIAAAVGSAVLKNQLASETETRPEEIETTADETEKVDEETK